MLGLLHTHTMHTLTGIIDSGQNEAKARYDVLGWALESY